MDVFPKTPEIVGIGFIAVAVLWVFWKITTRLLDVIEKNANANASLAKNIEANTKMTESVLESNRATKQAVDSFTQILVQSQLKEKQ